MSVSPSRPGGWVLVAAMTALFSIDAAPSQAQAKAKWTVAVMASGTYADLQEELRTVGATDDVNVVVLHEAVTPHSVDEVTVPPVAYSLLKDTDSSHKPGQCCSGDGECCGVKDIPLSTLGVATGARLDADTATKFLTYVGENFPAEHYLVSLRGVPMSNTELLTPGLSVLQMVEAFKTLSPGKKIDVVNLGFCLSANADWAHAFAEVADYFVAPPNFTNPPVAARWRIHRWARELIRNPALGGRELATTIVDIFTDTTKVCIEQGHNCSNLVVDEPWTVGALDLSKAQDFARAARGLACVAMEKLDLPTLEKLKEKTTRYGDLDAETLHLDIRHFAENLKADVDDPDLEGAAETLLEALDAYVIASRVEEGGFAGHSYGLSAYFNAKYGSSQKIGTFQQEALWRPFTTDLTLPEPTSLAFDPMVEKLDVGKSVALTVRGVKAPYGAMCPLGDVKLSVDPPEAGEIVLADGMPAAFRALHGGSAKIIAERAGEKTSVTIAVAGKGGGGGDDGKKSDGGGCSVSGPAAPSSLALSGMCMFALAVVLRARKRSIRS